MDLQQLIEQQKKGRSYATLAKDTGGALTRGRLQQIATTPQKEWLKPDNIRALATALHVSEVTVVLAVAESLGLDTRSSAVRLQDYLPAQTGKLTERQMAAIGALIRSIVTEEEGEGHDGPAATTQAGESPAADGAPDQVNVEAQFQAAQMRSTDAPTPVDGRQTPARPEPAPRNPG